MISAQNPHQPLQMTLLTNRLAQSRLQSGRIDNVFFFLVTPSPPLPLPPSLMTPDVDLSGSVAALATNRKALEDRLMIAIAALLDRLDMIGMAEQTQRLHRTVKLVDGRSQV